MYYTKHVMITNTDETSVFTIPNGYVVYINYIYVANHGGSTNSIDLWWETGGVDQMYFFDGTSIGGGNKEILGGQSEAPIFVLHNGDTVKAQASSSGDIEIAFTFKLMDQPQSFVNFNGS